LRVPEDISVVSFDDIPLSSLLQPPLTTVRQPIELLGHEGVRLLIELIQTGKTTRPLVQRFPVELIERESVKTLNAA
jgi:LacI family transcriptional regulator